MKNSVKLGLFMGAVLFATSCSLDQDPISEFSEITVGGKDTTDTSVKYKTKEEMKTQYDGIYKSIQDAQEAWYADMLVLNETHADNAYCGSSGAELTSLEQQTQDGTNKNIERDWNSFLGYINSANRVINNVDLVPDQSLTQAERKQWKAEAKIWRAWILFDMVRLWGDVPVVTEEAPNITAENVEEVYPLLYPSRKPVAEVYAQIIADLNAALEAGGAPDVNTSNKFLLTKSVAKALLARVYAEKPVRDYAKVIQYAEAVEDDGFELVADYSDLFSVNEAKTDVNFRNTTESIFEVTYPVGSGSWVTWMFGIDHVDPSSTYNWAKWITPSRDLIQAFENEGDNVRMNEAIVWGQPSWSNHYPSDHYPFMYKTRSKYNSIIKIRLADILLLKAEAYVETGNLQAAAGIVNTIRNRAKLEDLPGTTTTSKDKMADAVLNERRLELAFEGQRWFDLVRTGKVFAVMNSLNSRDSGRLPVTPVTEATVLLPIPQTQIDKNPNLTQNTGY